MNIYRKQKNTNIIKQTMKLVILSNDDKFPAKTATYRRNSDGPTDPVLCCCPASILQYNTKSKITM